MVMLACPDEEEQDSSPQQETSLRDAYTGEQVRANDPERYAKIIELLARGIPKRRIRDELGCNYYTVCAIEQAAFPDVVAAKAMLSRKLLSAATASIDSAEERALAGKASALDAKLLTEAYMNVNGEASATISVEHSWPQLLEFEKGQPLRECHDSAIDV